MIYRMNNEFTLDEEILISPNRTTTLNLYINSILQNNDETEEIIRLLKKVKITFKKLFLALCIYKKIKEVYSYKVFNENVSKFDLNNTNYELIKNKQLVLIICIILAHKTLDDNSINFCVWSKLSRYSKNNLFLGEYLIIKLLNFDYLPSKNDFLEVKYEFCVNFEYFEIELESKVWKNKLKRLFIKIISCCGLE